MLAALLFALATVALSVGCTELTVQMLYPEPASVPSSPDPVLLWRPNPGVFHFEQDQVPFVYRINSRGFRGEELSVDSAGGGIRVGVLGDSALFGMGTSDADSFCGQLETRLRLRFHRADIQVVNLAIMGSTSFQGAQRLKSVGDDIDLDVVLVGFNNGTEPLRTTERQISHVDSPMLWVYRLLYETRVYRMFLACQRAENVNDRMMTPEERKENRLRAQTGGPGALMARVPLLEHRGYLEEIRDFCRKRAIPVIFVNLPYNYALKQGPFRDVPSSDLNHAYRQAIREIGREEGASLLDAEAIWRLGGERKSDFLPGDRLHLSQQGNQRLVEDAMVVLEPLLSKLVSTPREGAGLPP